jgi:DNA-binding NtrC family response regulator
VIRKIICKYLDSLKVEYHVCKDGEEAAQWFKINFMSCACIISDLEMPRMGGDALIAFAKTINPCVPCFIVSGNDIGTVNLPPGVKRAIVKPISIEQVMDIMKDVSQHQNAI